MAIVTLPNLKAQARQQMMMAFMQEMLRRGTQSEAAEAEAVKWQNYQAHQKDMAKLEEGLKRGSVALREGRQTDAEKAQMEAVANMIRGITGVPEMPTEEALMIAKQYPNRLYDLGSQVKSGRGYRDVLAGYGRPVPVPGPDPNERLWKQYNEYLDAYVKMKPDDPARGEVRTLLEGLGRQLGVSMGGVGGPADPNAPDIRSRALANLRGGMGGEAMGETLSSPRTAKMLGDTAKGLRQQEKQAEDREERRAVDLAADRFASEHPDILSAMDESQIRELQDFIENETRRAALPTALGAGLPGGALLTQVLGMDTKAGPSMSAILRKANEILIKGKPPEPGGVDRLLTIEPFSSEKKNTKRSREWYSPHD